MSPHGTLCWDNRQLPATLGMPADALSHAQDSAWKCTHIVLSTANSSCPLGIESALEPGGCQLSACRSSAASLFAQAYRFLHRGHSESVQKNLVNFYRKRSDISSLPLYNKIENVIDFCRTLDGEARGKSNHKKADCGSHACGIAPNRQPRHHSCQMPDLRTILITLNHVRFGSKLAQEAVLMQVVNSHLLFGTLSTIGLFNALWF